MKSLIVALLVFSSVAFSQELNCTVTVNMDNIPNSNRHLLDGFSQSVSNYMNKTRFSNSDWQNDKINCGLNIFMITATSDGKVFQKINLPVHLIKFIIEFLESCMTMFSLAYLQKRMPEKSL